MNSLYPNFKMQSKFKFSLCSLCQQKTTHEVSQDKEMWEKRNSLTFLTYQGKRSARIHKEKWLCGDQNFIRSRNVWTDKTVFELKAVDSGQLATASILQNSHQCFRPTTPICWDPLFKEKIRAEVDLSRLKW